MKSSCIILSWKSFSAKVLFVRRPDRSIGRPLLNRIRFALRSSILRRQKPSR